MVLPPLPSCPSRPIIYSSAPSLFLPLPLSISQTRPLPLTSILMSHSTPGTSFSRLWTLSRKPLPQTNLNCAFVMPFRPDFDRQIRIRRNNHGVSKPQARLRYFRSCVGIWPPSAFSITHRAKDSNGCDDSLSAASPISHQLCRSKLDGSGDDLCSPFPILPSLFHSSAFSP